MPKSNRIYESGKVTGWNDPRLHTVQALIRRGFQPEALRLYAIQVGLTKTDIRMNWDNLESFNRSLIDLQANRYMVVLDPVKLSLRGGPDTPGAQASTHPGTPPGAQASTTRLMVDLHPDDPKRGRKAVPADRKSIHISREDCEKFQGNGFSFFCGCDDHNISFGCQIVQ